MLEVTAAMLTDRGLVRAANEDAVAYVVPPPGEAGETTLAILADGMGGHAAGEVASALAIETILDRFFQSPNDIQAALAASFAAANLAILEQATSSPEFHGMGTTCTAIAIRNGDAWLAHIGDSRAYLLRGAEFRQVSEDHSHVARMVRDGLLTEAQAQIHPDRNIITQALGTAQDISPQYWKTDAKLQDGDRFLLCSDGLSDLVAPANIAQAAAAGAPIDACRTLIAAALAAGGTDNVSVGVIALHAAPTQSRQRATRPQQLAPDGEAP